MQIIDDLRRELKVRGLSVLKFSKETGISAYKIYKWFDGKSKPIYEDRLILEGWLRKDLDNVPRETNKYKEINIENNKSEGKELLASLKREIETLNKHIDLLNKQAEINSKRIAQYEQVNTARIWTIVECQKVLRSKVLKESFEAANDQVDTLYLDILQKIQESENV